MGQCCYCLFTGSFVGLKVSLPCPDLHQESLIRERSQSDPSSGKTQPRLFGEALAGLGAMAVTGADCAAATYLLWFIRHPGLEIRRTGWCPL